MLGPGKLRNSFAVLIFSIAVVLIAWRCWTRLRPANNPRDPQHTSLCDFQDVVYYPSRAALAGISPYDARQPEAGGVYLSRFPAGNTFPVYAPLIFIFSLPVAALPLVPAEIAYWIINLALLVIYAYVLLRLAEMPIRLFTVALLAAGLLLSRPGHANFYFGAITLPMTLATLGAWLLADRRPWPSALCLAIASIKPTFGGPLFVLLMLRGSYRAALTGLAIGAGANLAVMAFLLPHDLTSGTFLAQLVANQAATDSDPAVDPLQSASRIDFLMVAERLAGVRFPSVARLALALVLLGVTGWHLRLARDKQQPLATAIACLTIAICIYHNIYDALLVAPSALLAIATLGRANSSPNRTFGGLLGGCVAVVAINYLSSKQFAALLAAAAPALSDGQRSAPLWTLICTLNGVCLLVAWCILHVLLRRNVAHRNDNLPVAV